MNTHINRRTLLRSGSALLLAVTLAACRTQSGTTRPPQPTAGTGQPAPQPTTTAQPAPQPTTLPAGPTTGRVINPTAIAQPIGQPTFDFAPQAGGPGTLVTLHGWNFVPGAPVKLRLGLPQPIGEVLVAASSDDAGLWSAQLTMPGALPSGEPITQSDLRLVVMNDADVALASAAFAFTPVSQSGQQNAQPATDPIDAVQRFLAAAQVDRTGKQSVPYAGGNLLVALQGDLPDIGGLLGEQNPFSAFRVDTIVTTAPPLTYGQVTLSYGSPPQPGATRIFTVREEYGTWRVTEISAASAHDPALSPERQARNAAANFVALLSSGRYQEASAFFGGDMQVFLDQNPDLSGDAAYNPELRGQLLETRLHGKWLSLPGPTSDHRCAANW